MQQKKTMIITFKDGRENVTLFLGYVDGQRNMQKAWEAEPLIL